MVHKIWSPLCTKLNKSTDDLVFREAFNILATMASTAKEFIRSRSLKYVYCKNKLMNKKLIKYIILMKIREVMPAIVERLTSSAKESKKVLKGSAYYTSHKYKMQFTILCNLGDLILNLNFIEKDMYDISEAMTYYLDKNQPIDFQVQTITYIIIVI